MSHQHWPNIVMLANLDPICRYWTNIAPILFASRVVGLLTSIWTCGLDQGINAAMRKLTQSTRLRQFDVGPTYSISALRCMSASCIGPPACRRRKPTRRAQVMKMERRPTGCLRLLANAGQAQQPCSLSRKRILPAPAAIFDFEFVYR